MLKIRLRRMGSRHRPFYRVVVSESRRVPRATALEEVGYYDPRKTPATLSIDVDRVDYWMSRGAQPSDTVKRLVKKARAEPAPAEVEAPAEAEAEDEAEAETAVEAEAVAEEATEDSEAEQAAASDTSEASDTSDSDAKAEDATDEKKADGDGEAESA